MKKNLIKTLSMVVCAISIFSTTAFASNKEVQTIKNNSSATLKNGYDVDENGYEVYIGKGYFSNYYGEESDIVIPSKIKGIDIWCVSNASLVNKDYLKSVTISEGITELSKWAIQDCANLTKVVFPESITYVGDYPVVRSNKNLKFYVQSERVKNLLINAGVEEESIVIQRRDCDVDENGFEVYIGKGYFNNYYGNESDIVIPSKIKGIDIWCVSNASLVNKDYLKSVTISEGITELSKWAIQDCANLTKVVLPESITYVGDYPVVRSNKDLKFYVQSERVKNLLINAGVEEESIVLSEKEL